MTDALLPTLEPHHVAEVASLQDLAKVLRLLRRRQARRQGDSELTYRELAAKTGWSIGIISGYFGGRALPPTDRFDILVDLLDTTPIERGMLATARDRVQESRRRTSPRTANRPVPRQLPGNNFRFTGRTAQCAALDAVARSTGQIVVLCGTAGIGKPIT